MRSQASERASEARDWSKSPVPGPHPAAAVPHTQLATAGRGSANVAAPPQDEAPPVAAGLFAGLLESHRMLCASAATPASAPADGGTLPLTTASVAQDHLPTDIQYRIDRYADLKQPVDAALE